MRELTISTHFVAAVVFHCRNRPRERDALLSNNGIPPELLQQTAARVSAKAFADLIRDTMLFLQDEALGYGKAPQPLGSWEMMCQSLLTAETLGEALRRFSRFYRLIDWGIAPRLQRDGDSVSFVLESSADIPEFLPYIHESFLFYAHRLANWLIAEQIPLHDVQFRFKKPDYADEYQYMFPASPIRFEQPVAAIHFARHYLLRPLRQDRESLQEFLEHANYAMLVQQYDQNSWHYRVRSLLAHQLADNPAYANIAGQLNIHPQTLRRQLQREGFRYQDIKDRVRRDAAIHWLGSHSKSVEETSALSGFSEPSSFIRSFKRWTGVTPYTYRKARN